MLVCGTDPTDESRFVIAQYKNWFGPKATTGLSYRIEKGDVVHGGDTFPTSAVVWPGEVQIDGRGLLAGPGDPEERTGIDEAVAHLDAMVAASPDGRIDAAEAKRAAVALGVGDKTMQRARLRLGLTVDRAGFGPGARYWWCRSTMVDKLSEDRPSGEPVHHGQTVTQQQLAGSDPPMVDSVKRVSTMGLSEPSCGVRGSC